MKRFTLKFWLLAVWFGFSVVFMSVAAENLDVSILLAAVVNLAFCSSAIKSNKQVFDKALENI